MWGKAMPDTVGQRVDRYLLDGSDEDLKRLLAISERMSPSTRTALRRSGVQAGWAVINCGCGPIGGLLDLAELAGPAGRVIGLDASKPTVRRARSAVAALGLGNVEVVVSDVNDLAAGAVGGPFELAFTRLFLGTSPTPCTHCGRSRPCCALAAGSSRRRRCVTRHTGPVASGGGRPAQ